jgi:hypothetical protein
MSVHGVVGLSFLLALLSASAHAACGDNGGPGYRNQAGKCVGWEALVRQCGNPPSKMCTPERVASGAENAAANGATIRSLMDRSHDVKNLPNNPQR